MDPNETLRGMRIYVRAILNPEGATDEQVVDAAPLLAERVKALDEWLTKGGFLPTAWDPGGRLAALAGEHGLDWADDGAGYSGRCDCHNWARTDVDTFDALLALYEVHLRVSGVPDHRPAQP